MKIKFIKSMLFSTIGLLSTSAIAPMVLTSCGKKKQKTIAVKSVELDSARLGLNEGENIQLKANVLPVNATNKKVTWRSSDESIATVDQYGRVKALLEGTVIITVTTDDGGKTADCEVEIFENTQPAILGRDYGTWGNIKVIYKLLSNHECCLLTKSVDGQNGYVEGAGILRIPDHVVWNGENYYVKRIPSDWSDGENDINGLEFESDVSHLKEICDYAFKGTNVLDNYQQKFVTFPEGLQYIGTEAFYNVDLGNEIEILGYVFPSTLNAINVKAFANAGRIQWILTSPSSLTFKGNFNPVNIKEEAFSPLANKHAVQYIYAPTIEIATNISEYIKAYFSGDFEMKTQSRDYLVPKAIG